ncbi:MAG: acylneuraminate cytidylyltransferase family protein [Muribaculum sp.]|nr:acylneuraminate cytidylyltransferase family protein [Muribaculum sp.]
MKSLYLIPARGGSKGIPGKNIKPFLGKPLICHAIDQAKEVAAEGDEICVSTDSEEIKTVVENYGLQVPFLRPDYLATDTAGTYEVIHHALQWYKENGKEFDVVVLLQTTSPLRRAEDIRNALAIWHPGIDMVVSVCEAATNPYYNAFETDSYGNLHICKGDGHYVRRQDAPKVWEYNGAVYVMSVDSLLKMPYSQFPARKPYMMPTERSIDLDTPTDWLRAEQLAIALPTCRL